MTEREIDLMTERKQQKKSRVFFNDSMTKTLSRTTEILIKLIFILFELRQNFFYVVENSLTDFFSAMEEGQRSSLNKWEEIQRKDR